jgi:hypothetical protein
MIRSSAWAVLVLVLPVFAALLPAAVGGVSSSGRLRREPPTVTSSSALWPDSARGEPLPRAKAIVDPADTTWGSVWLPLEAVFDADNYEHEGMKLKFNAQWPARLGTRVRVAERDELQRHWEAYKSVPEEELGIIETQANRVGTIMELDRDDETAKISLHPDIHGARASAGEL